MKISIVTLSFNQRAFLKQAMDSVLSQKYPKLEYIVVDPGSTDGSRELIRSYGDRITHRVFEPDRGASDGLNKGFSLATGEVFGFLNADDILYSGSLKRVGDFFQANPNYDVVMGDGYKIDGQGQKTRHFVARDFSVKRFFYGGTQWLQQSTFFRAESYHRSPKFNLDNRTCWDGELFLHFANQGAKVGYIRADLGGFRIHDESISGSGRMNRQYQKDCRRIFRQLTGREWRATDEALRVFFPSRRFSKKSGCAIAAARRERRHMRIAFLWTGLSGYMNACLKELFAQEGVELFVSHQVPEQNAPFDDDQFEWISNRYTWQTTPDFERLEQKLSAFKPDIVVFAGWHIFAYRRMTRRFFRRCLRIMAMDNPWLGSLKQRLGVFVSPVCIKPMADMVWLPGERQATFARKLGFSQSAIMRGSYSCDLPMFETVHVARIRQGEPLPHRFVFIGRFIPEKCIDNLVASYRLYRKQTANPWPLICCGTGPMRALLEKEEGIRMDGFVQPAKLPEVLAGAGCLVLPSKFEPWALVVHEAAAAGKLILASESVGSVSHLLQPGYNGFILDDRNVVGFASAMSRVSAMSDAQLDQMSQASHMLSQQFSPVRWTNTLLRSYETRALKNH